MKKKIILAVCIVFIFVLAGCSKKPEDNQNRQWDCSVDCAEDPSADKYVITYSEEKVTSQTGVLTFQNENDFDIKIHLRASDEEERTVEIPEGGSGCLKQLKENTEYTVGVHAEVPENTMIKLMVYDGTDSN